MTTKARDVRYGRRGGRWIDGEAPAAPVACDVCGAAVHVGTRHVGCDDATRDDAPPSLFDARD